MYGIERVLRGAILGGILADLIELGFFLARH